MKGPLRRFSSKNNSNKPRFFLSAVHFLSPQSEVSQPTTPPNLVRHLPLVRRPSAAQGLMGRNPLVNTLNPKLAGAQARVDEWKLVKLSEFGPSLTLSRLLQFVQCFDPNLLMVYCILIPESFYFLKKTGSQETRFFHVFFFFFYVPSHRVKIPVLFIVFPFRSLFCFLSLSLFSLYIFSLKRPYFKRWPETVVSGLKTLHLILKKNVYLLWLFLYGLKRTLKEPGKTGSKFKPCFKTSKFARM